MSKAERWGMVVGPLLGFLILLLIIFSTVLNSYSPKEPIEVRDRADRVYHYTDRSFYTGVYSGLENTEFVFSDAPEYETTNVWIITVRYESEGPFAVHSTYLDGEASTEQAEETCSFGSCRWVVSTHWMDNDKEAGRVDHIVSPSTRVTARVNHTNRIYYVRVVNGFDLAEYVYGDP